MKELLKDKIAVVTGASRGIGKAIAKALHQQGALVIITGRYASALNTTAKEIGSRCHPFVCDQRHPEAIETMAYEVVSQYGIPHILVNNAGVMKSNYVASTSLEEWQEIIDTNLTGVFLTTKAFLPSMMKNKKGDIIMISSMSGKKGDPGASAYAASKFGLQGFSQSLMYEVRKYNIRVSVLNPSRVDKGEDTPPRYGKGKTLHMNDIAKTVVHLVTLPGRTLIRDIDIWGTNP